MGVGVGAGCASPIAAAMGFPVSDGLDILLDVIDRTRAGGVADQIFNCAINNGCGACLR